MFGARVKCQQYCDSHHDNAKEAHNLLRSKTSTAWKQRIGLMNIITAAKLWTWLFCTCRSSLNPFAMRCVCIPFRYRSMWNVIRAVEQHSLINCMFSFYRFQSNFAYTRQDASPGRVFIHIVLMYHSLCMPV